MVWQSLIAGGVVAACALYATWRLMPGAWKRGVARLASGLPLPAAVRRRLAADDLMEGGGGCSACGLASQRAKHGKAAIRFARHRAR